MGQEHHSQLRENKKTGVDSAVITGVSNIQILGSREQALTQQCTAYLTSSLRPLIRQTSDAMQLTQMQTFSRLNNSICLLHHAHISNTIVLHQALHANCSLVQEVDNTLCVLKLPRPKGSEHINQTNGLATPPTGSIDSALRTKEAFERCCCTQIAQVKQPLESSKLHQSQSMYTRMLWGQVAGGQRRDAVKATGLQRDLRGTQWRQPMQKRIMHCAPNSQPIWYIYTSHNYEFVGMCMCGMHTGTIHSPFTRFKGISST